MPTPVSATSSSAPFLVDVRVTSTRPPRRRELDRVADQVADHLAQALRVVALADRLVGHVHDQLDALAVGARLGLLDGVLDHGAQVVRSKVEQHQARFELGQLEQVGRQPVEALDLLPALVEELGLGRLVLYGALGEQLVEGAQRGDRRAQLVRHVGQEVATAVAVAADELDRFLDALGHRVEGVGQLGHLARVAGRFDARIEVALGQLTRAADVRRRIGLDRRSAMKIDTITATISAMIAATAMTRMIDSIDLGAEGERLRQRDRDQPLRRAGALGVEAVGDRRDAERLSRDRLALLALARRLRRPAGRRARKPSDPDSSGSAAMVTVTLAWATNWASSRTRPDSGVPSASRTPSATVSGSVGWTIGLWRSAIARLVGEQLARDEQPHCPRAAIEVFLGLLLEVAVQQPGSVANTRIRAIVTTARKPTTRRARSPVRKRGMIARHVQRNLSVRRTRSPLHGWSG